MLSTMAHVMSDDMLEYEGRLPAATPDAENLGFSALYRLYEAARGWVVLCVTTEREWRALTTVLGAEVDLLGDARFAGPTDRLDNDAVLAEIVGGILRTRSAAEWEKVMTPADVACVEVVDGPVHAVLMDEGGLMEQLGMTATVEHPLFERHLRTGALAALSRSSTTIGPGCLVGQHTDAILAELGYSGDRIAELRAAGIVAG
jgi:crotonobetainyl-CoA:carnitine CoA-transferase CaiB-like acyl-CoA transferase